MITLAKLPTALLTIALAAAGLGACDGSSQVASEQASESERDAARGLLTQIAAIAEQPREAERLLRATDFTALLALVAPPGTPVVTPLAVAVPDDALAECLLATSKAATLTECELGEHVIDGTWSIQHQRAHTELVDVFVLSPGHTDLPGELQGSAPGDSSGGSLWGSLWINANLSAASPAPSMPIDGSLEVSLMWTAGEREHALDASIRIDGLVLEGPGCALGGTITIRGRFADAPDSTTTLWFGPTCRDIHMSRQAPR